MEPNFKQRARELLGKQSVSAIEAPASIVVIDGKDNLYDAFQKLLDNNILSAPVHDKEKNEFIGFLDVRDLVSFGDVGNDEQKVNGNPRLRDLIQHGTGQFKMPTTDGVTVSYLARRNRFVSVGSDAPLSRVSELLAKGFHRVPVVDAQGKVINVISQSSIVKYLADHLRDAILDNKNDPTIEALKIGTKPVLSVSKKSTVINTFRLMDQKKRSGVALVDETGRFVGTTTGKDLGLFLDNPSLAALNLPIFEHLQIIRQKQTDIKSPSISVFDHDRISRAIGLIAATRVHRVFVVDTEKDFRAVRVISITDILKYLME